MSRDGVSRDAAGRPAPRRPGRRRRAAPITIFIICVAACALVGAALWLARGGLRSSGPLLTSPPAFELQGIDPAAAEAIRTADAALRKDPSPAGEWGRLGMVLLAHDFYPAAATCLEQASRRDASDPRWPYLQGLALLQGTPDAGAAVPRLEQAAALASAPPEVHLKLAEVLLAQGEVERAEVWLRRAAAANPRSARARAGLGRAAYLRGDLPAAVAELTASKALAGDVAATHALLAEVHSRLGNRDAAEAERQAAAALPSTFTWPDPYWQQVVALWTGAMASLERADDLQKKGKLEEAIQLLRDTTARYPDAILAQLTLGRYLLQSQRLAEAEAAFRRAVVIAPSSFEARYELAGALQAQQRVAEAAVELSAALALQPEYPPAHYQLAQCRLSTGDSAGALESLRAAVRFRPSFAQAQRDLGRMLVQAGHLGEGIEHLEAAVRLNPSDREAAKLLEALR